MVSYPVILAGEKWELQLVTRKDLPKAWGDCDIEKKIIRIRKDLSIRNFLDTLLHEITHAQRWHEDEEFVNRSSTEAAKAIALFIKDNR